MDFMYKMIDIPIIHNLNLNHFSILGINMRSNTFFSQPLQQTSENKNPPPLTSQQRQLTPERPMQSQLASQQFTQNQIENLINLERKSLFQLSCSIKLDVSTYKQYGIMIEDFKKNGFDSSIINSAYQELTALEEKMKMKLKEYGERHRALLSLTQPSHPKDSTNDFTSTTRRF